MAKKDKIKKAGSDENKDVNAEIKKMKKKISMVIALVLVTVISVGGFVGFNMMGKNKEEKAAKQEELNAMALKDYPLEDEESQTIYSRDIKKQTYVLKDGAVLFEGTMVFHNKLCANLYSGITGRDEQLATEPDLTVDDLFGDKVMKDALNRYLQASNKADISSAEKISEGLKEAINKQFVESFGHEVVKGILVTNHVVK